MKRLAQNMSTSNPLLEIRRVLDMRSLGHHGAG